MPSQPLPPLQRTISTDKQAIATPDEQQSIENVPGTIETTTTPSSTSPVISLRSLLVQTGKASLRAWFDALKHAFSCYLALHLAFLATTFFAVLFIVKDFSTQSLPYTLLGQLWARKDTGHFNYIALYGYTDAYRTAFFPLYPLLERSMLWLVSTPYIAGLIISNIAGLLMLVVLYRLVREDFNVGQAQRTILYLSIFPTAFFFAAAYSESVFMLLSLLSFYTMRRGRWWLAGLFGGLACLTRAAGVLLLVPFAYEYLRQHQFDIRKFRFDILGGGLMAGSVGLFSLYCYYKFHDPLAFSHAESYWGHEMHFPGYDIWLSIHYISQAGRQHLLSFMPLRNILDLVPDLFVLALIVLGFVGPWRLPVSLMSYNLYALASYLFLQLYPVMNPFPLTSVPRYLLAIFPAFIVLSAIGKHRGVHLNYIAISCAFLFFLLIQFLTGHWIT